jgi:hypothetical protein
MRGKDRLFMAQQVLGFRCNVDWAKRFLCSDLGADVAKVRANHAPYGGSSVGCVIDAPFRR